MNAIEKDNASTKVKCQVKKIMPTDRNTKA